MNDKYSVPGWLTKSECDLITELISTLHDNAKILEIGTAFGKSSLCILDGMKSNQSLDICDLWSDDPWQHIADDPGFALGTLHGDKDKTFAAIESLQKYGIRKTWESHVMPHKNSNLIRNVFQQSSLTLVDTDYDLVFLDGNHKYDHLLVELVKFKHVPIICGDDFDYYVGDGVVKAVMDFGKTHRKVLTVDLDSSFYILKNANIK